MQGLPNGHCGLGRMSGRKSLFASAEDAGPGRAHALSSGGSPLLGDRYGRLVVLEEAKPYIWRGRVARRRWLCLCDCGRETIVRDDVLKSGHTKSCGCFRDDVTRKRTLKHGARANCQRQVEYDVWLAILRNHALQELPQHWTAKDGKGFRHFVRDVGRRPSSRHQFVRIDERVPLSANNCRWVAGRQRKGTPRRRVTVAGQQMTLREAASFLSIPYNVLCKRLQRGWPIDRAVQSRYQSRACTT